MEGQFHQVVDHGVGVGMNLVYHRPLCEVAMFEQLWMVRSEGGE